MYAKNWVEALKRRIRTCIKKIPDKTVQDAAQSIRKRLLKAYRIGIFSDHLRLKTVQIIYLFHCFNQNLKISVYWRGMKKVSFFMHHPLFIINIFIIYLHNLLYN